MLYVFSLNDLSHSFMSLGRENIMVIIWYMRLFKKHTNIEKDYRKIVKEQSTIIKKQNEYIKKLESNLDSLKEASKLNNDFMDYHNFYVKDRKKYEEIIKEVTRILDKYNC